MRRSVSILAVLCGLGLAACRADLGGLQILDVEGLAAWQATRSDFSVCDANNADTRRRLGVIPGAVLLTHYRDHDPVAELSGDRSQPVVFYCHSEMCGAGADAARKAIAAGYRDVWVMAPGIRGWIDSGRSVARPDAPAEPS